MPRSAWKRYLPELCGGLALLCVALVLWWALPNAVADWKNKPYAVEAFRPALLITMFVPVWATVTALRWAMRRMPTPAGYTLAALTTLAAATLPSLLIMILW